MTLDLTIVLLGVAVFLLAGTVKGTVGIGLPITSVGIMSQLDTRKNPLILAPGRVA